VRHILRLELLHLSQDYVHGASPNAAFGHSLGHQMALGDLTPAEIKRQAA
jgi:hypothetical protein